MEQKLIALQEQAASDPEIVDELLTKEMMNLSLKDRNDIQEEIHGVKCMAVEETPELLQAALRQLAYEIDVNTPDSRKQAYLQSLRMKLKNDELQNHQRILRELHSPQYIVQSNSRNMHNTHSNNNATSNKQSYCYIHDDVEFRLRFLRCELFHVQKSAKRMLRFLDLVLELFGEFALRRPIQLSDFTKDEMLYLRKGRNQVMPNRDRSGRRISTIFPEDANSGPSSECPPLIKAKILLYISWAVGYKDVETQRKGQIILVWYDRSFSIRYSRQKLLNRWDAYKSTRVTAIHICSPDTPHYRLRRGLAVMRIGNENRSRLRVHLGESVELRYALQGYGIPSEDIPISFTGTIKMKYLVQWMRIRRAVESYDDHCLSSSTSTSGTTIVECPEANDVLFRKGNSYTSHPGNAKLRAMIVSKAYHEDDGNSSNINNNNKNCNINDSVVATKKRPKKRPKQLASEVFRERLEKSRSNAKAADDIVRYLIWNSEMDWWNEMTDWEEICMKIEYITREICKSRGTGNSISKLKNDNIKKKSKTSSITPINKSQKRSLPVNFHSGTTLFRSQDGSSDNMFRGKFKKSFCSGKSDDDNEDLIPGVQMTECFGMKFPPAW